MSTSTQRFSIPFEYSFFPPRRVRDGQTQDYYYDTKWRMLQQQLGGSGAKPEEYIWSERYAHSPVVRFRDTNGDGTMDETFYYTTDANNNVTAMVQTTGSVQERYISDGGGLIAPVPTGGYFSFIDMPSGSASSAAAQLSRAAFA